MGGTFSKTATCAAGGTFSAFVTCCTFATCLTRNVNDVCALCDLRFVDSLIPWLYKYRLVNTYKYTLRIYEHGWPEVVVKVVASFSESSASAPSSPLLAEPSVSSARAAAKHEVSYGRCQTTGSLLTGLGGCGLLALSAFAQPFCKEFIYNLE